MSYLLVLGLACAVLALVGWLGDRLDRLAKARWERRYPLVLAVLALGLSWTTHAWAQTQYEEVPWACSAVLHCLSTKRCGLSPAALQEYKTHCPSAVGPAPTGGDKGTWSSTITLECGVRCPLAPHGYCYNACTGQPASNVVVVRKTSCDSTTLVTVLRDLIAGKPLSSEWSVISTTFELKPPPGSPAALRAHADAIEAQDQLLAKARQLVKACAPTKEDTP